MRATRHDGAYPRPMLCRDRWTSLDGPWDFAHDDADEGRAARWFDRPAVDPFDRRIEVPYPPESPASGVGDRGFHPIVWYRRRLPRDLVVGEVEDGQRLLLHFGAVDHSCEVWFDGRLVVRHVGGQTPFTADLTDDHDEGIDEHVLVVRAEDDPGALAHPRGKQDWREKPHDIWYERTTGIWQSVWLEPVPRDHVVDVAWVPDIASGVVHGEIALARRPPGRIALDLTLRADDDILSEMTVVTTEQTTHVEISVPALRNGQDRSRISWTPESPNLIDIELVLRQRQTQQVVDAVSSYVGLRSVSVGAGTFELNGRPCYVRAVLNQGYRPDSHLANRGSDDLRVEVETIKAMGFNTVRIHQKAEDPRFLYWADRLGLMVWGETAGAYEFSPTAVALLTTEWLDLVRRDRSHPSVVVWVPINESWGVQDIASVPAQQHFSQSLASLTRALDPSRPVVSNEGWEHVDSDILGLHDYTVDADELRRRYVDRHAVAETVLDGHGPQGRRPMLGQGQAAAFAAGDAPLMITEFGGISLSDDADSWGYGQVRSMEEYGALLTQLFEALRASTEVVGFCYTQYMDTGQETNGLLFADGTPKLPVEAVRRIVTGEPTVESEEPASTIG